MKRRIFRAMLFMALGTAVAFALLSVPALYRSFADDHRARLDSQTQYVAAAMELSSDPAAYLQSVKGVDARLTWVGADGAVRFDSDRNPDAMDSHLDRPEIRRALADGAGDSQRFSATLGETTFYSARRLSDGSVLRLASTRASLFSILLGLMGVLALLFLAVGSVAVLAAGRVTRAIVRPINRLNLERPLDNEVYDELTPLLTQLEQQNQRIARQMEELSRRQTRFAAITDNMAEGLAVLDGEQTILSINESAARLFEAPAQIPPGMHILQLCRDIALIRALDKAARTGLPAGETMARAGRYYRLLASPVRAGERVDGTVLLILDVTDGTLSEQSRREFSANVSHELKTPLTAISGYAEIMQNGMASPEDMRVFAGRIHGEAKRLIQLIEDIIRLSRLDEDAPVPEDMVDLLEVARETVRRLDGQAASAQVSLKAEGTPLTVRGERAMIEEMVYNLADNAVKYGRAGGWASIETAPDRLIVSDNGIGISPEDQARVFERFYRADKSHSKAIGGTGLGLSIVKHAAQRLDARLSLASRLGEGTRVEIVFPQDRLSE